MKRRAPHHRRWLLSPVGAAALAVAQLTPGSTLAQVETTRSLSDTIPVSMTVSGGISRGVHQGGVNWVLVEFLRNSTDNAAFRAALAQAAFPGDPRAVVPPHRLAVATGASAGNINSILTALEWCRAPGAPQAPEASLFWQIWVRTGWEQMFPHDFSDMRTNTALLDRRYFDTVHFETLKARVGPGLRRPNCQVPVGLTTTKLKPDSMPVDGAGRIWAHTQRFASVFEVRSSPTGHVLGFWEPRDTVFRDRGMGRIIRLPGIGTSEAIDPLSVFLLTKASSAFPAAFAPVQLPYQDPLECVGSWHACPIHSDRYFLDGGAFDNNPLDLAYGLSDIYFPSQHPYSRTIYIDPDGIREGAPETARVKPDTTGSTARGIGGLLTLAAGYMQSSSQYELHTFARTLARDKNGVQRASWIRVTDRFHPIAGNFAGAFAAFFGRPFREYDFYVGVYDGLLFVAREMVCIPAMRAQEGAEPAPDDSRLKDCTTRVQRALITEDLLPLGDVAREAVSILYKSEFPDAAPITNARVAAVPGSLDARRLVLLRSLSTAIDSAAQMHDSEACKAPGLAPEQKFLCSGGFGDMLRRFATDSVRDVIWEDANNPKCQPEAWKTAPDEPCLGDRTLWSLIADREEGAAYLLGDLMHQAWRVENRLAADRRRAELDGPDFQALTEWADFLYRTALTRSPPRGPDRDPSTIQDVTTHRGKWIFEILPYHAGINFDAGGLEAGWRPTYHLSREFGAILPFGVNYRPGRSADSRPDVREEERRQGFAAVGAGVLWKVSSTWPRLAFKLDAVELSPQYIHPLGGGNEGAFAMNLGVYVLASKVRVGWRYLPNASESLLQGEQWSSSVALSDFNGLMYYLFRSFRN